jgi:hypothetical protein
MEKYDDKPIKDIRWTKYKIVVPTEQDKNDLEEAFEHLHYTDCDTNNVPVNQLIHEYLTPEKGGNPKTKNNIIVDNFTYKILEQNDTLKPQKKNYLADRGVLVIDRNFSLDMVISRTFDTIITTERLWEYFEEKYSGLGHITATGAKLIFI